MVSEECSLSRDFVLCPCWIHDGLIILLGFVVVAGFRRKVADSLLMKNNPFIM